MTNIKVIFQNTSEYLRFSDSAVSFTSTGCPDPSRREGCAGITITITVLLVLLGQDCYYGNTINNDILHDKMSEQWESGSARVWHSDSSTLK